MLSIEDIIEIEHKLCRVINLVRLIEGYCEAKEIMEINEVVPEILKELDSVMNEF